MGTLIFLLKTWFWGFRIGECQATQGRGWGLSRLPTHFIMILSSLFLFLVLRGGVGHHCRLADPGPEPPSPPSHRPPPAGQPGRGAVSGRSSRCRFRLWAQVGEETPGSAQARDGPPPSLPCCPRWWGAWVSVCIREAELFVFRRELVRESW